MTEPAPIGEVSERTGLSVDTLRFYEREGLVRPSRSGNRRRYSSDDVERLELVVKMRDLGISIPDIRSLLTWDDQIADMRHMGQDELSLVRDIGVVIERNVAALEARRRQIDAHLALFGRIRSKVAYVLDHGGVPDDPDLDVSNYDPALCGPVGGGGRGGVGRG